MNMIKIAAIILVIGGALALIYGGFNYTRAEHQASLGPFSFAVEGNQRVQIPTWGGVTAIVAGSGILLLGRRSRA